MNLNLISWILVGLIINYFLLKSDPQLKEERWLGLGFIILLRSVSGGVVSNYLFSAPLGGIDPSSFALLGIIPLIFLFISKMQQGRLA